MAKLTQEQIEQLAAEKAAAEERKAANKAKRDAEREARAGETKSDAFKRIATRRVNQALDTIATMRGLANKANYDYSEEQTNKIISALQGGIDKLAADFKAGGVRRADNGFGLD